MNEMIFLDNHSTTPIDPRVLEVMNDVYLNHFGNPSSVDHAYGEDAKGLVTIAARQVAALLGVNYQNVIFTSGATESINLAIKGRIAAIKEKKNKVRVLVNPLEHQAVISCCESLLGPGVELTYLKVDDAGRLDLEDLQAACTGGADLLCVMAANHEIGNIFPIKEVARIATENGVEFFCDATQGVGKMVIAFEEWGIDYLAFSAHKFYGPKGVGGLLVKDKNRLRPIFHGGGQQSGLRSGTLNVPGIVGLGKACELRNQEMNKDETAIAALKNRFVSGLKEQLKDLVFIGDPVSKLAGNISFSALGANNQGVISRIRNRVAISTGSACSSGVIAESRVLRALNQSPGIVDGFLRVCIGKMNTEKEINVGLPLIVQAISDCRKFSKGSE